MKKLTLLAILFLSVVNFAQFSFNIGVGKDLYSIPAIERINFDLWDGTPAYFERDEISNPLYFNLQLEYQSGSLIYGLHLAGAYAKYHINYIYIPSTINFEEYETDEDVPWARAEINAVILYEVPVTNNFSFIFGGGGGVQIMPPVVSDRFIYETTFDKILSFDFSDDIDLEYLANGKLVARAKLKLSDTFSLAAETNYLIVKQGNYEQPSDFLTAAVFLGVTF